MAIRPEVLFNRTFDAKIILPHAEGSHLEMESRFRNIPQNTFERLRAYFTRITPPTNIEHLMETDYLLSGGERVRFSRNADPAPPITAGAGVEKISHIRKERKWSRDLLDYDMRLVISQETPIAGKALRRAELDRVPGVRRRDKQRWIFRLQNPATVAIYMTRVAPRSGSYAETFEIEAEIVGSITTASIADLKNVSFSLLSLIQDSPILYTHDQRDAIIRDYNTILGRKIAGLPVPTLRTRRELGSAFQVQARNLKLRDMVWGGLLGGPIIYSVTPKAEGLRRHLFIHATGVWLVYPPFEFTKLSEMRPGLSGLIGTILDGENIPRAQRRESSSVAQRFYYIPFDVMALQGNIDIQTRDHRERLQYRDRLSRILLESKIPDLHVGTKSFHELPATPEEFAQQMKTMLAQLPTLDYQTDGLLFTPYARRPETKDTLDPDVRQVATYYNPQSDRQPLRRRVLTRRPDICKWKEWKELTIDLRVSMTQRRVEANQRLEGRRIQPIEFKGGFFPFDASINIDWKSPLLVGLSEGAIVEFEPHIPGGSEIIQLRPRRVRTDKTQPNRIEIATDVWDDINRPLTSETLMGQTLILMRQYHNQIKRRLFQSIPPGADLVDIGVGRGGDIAKQHHFGRVLAVEPNPQHIEEYRRRLGAFPERVSKVRLLQAGGEASQQIGEAMAQHFGYQEGGSPPRLVVSFMLSLSFFFRNESVLRQLVQTLRYIETIYTWAGGREPITVLYFTIEGLRTYQLLSSRENGEVKLQGATLKYTPPNQVDIHIGGTIVEEQAEYLVDLSRLEAEAQLHQKERPTPATEERFLFPEEMTMSSLYVSGSWLLDSSSPPKIIPTEMVDALPVDAKRISPGFDLKDEITGRPLPSLGDDVLEEITWAEGKASPLGEGGLPEGTRYYRISVVRDGSSFLHCLLKMMNPIYTRVGASRRLAMGRDLRQQLLALLPQVNPQYPSEAAALTEIWKGQDPRLELKGETARLPLNSYYFTLQQGRLHRLAMRGPDKQGYEYLHDLYGSAMELSLDLWLWVIEVLQVNLVITQTMPAGLTVTERHLVSKPQMTLYLHQTKTSSLEPIGYSRPEDSGSIVFPFPPPSP